MAETPTAMSSSEIATPPSSAAEQARIRKERREAKIKAGGSQRLNKITGLGGGIQRDPPPQPAATAPNPTSVADPEEVDISQHFYQPASNTRPRIPQQQQSPNLVEKQLSDDQLRAMMLGFPPNGSGPGSANAPSQIGPNPFASLPGFDNMGTGSAPSAEDPMLKLLQQMMGGMGGMPGEGPGGMPSFPGMAGMPGTGMPGQNQDGLGGAAVADPYAYLWRIVHAVFALALGLYIAFTAEFTGTRFERDMSALKFSTAGGLGWGESSIRFFYIFATAEILLQTSRFYLEKGVVAQGGILGMVMGFLPQPWKGYLALLLRYGRIWTTISSDAMVCVFVLGVCTWLRAF